MRQHGLSQPAKQPGAAHRAATIGLALALRYCNAYTAPEVHPMIMTTQSACRPLRAIALLLCLYASAALADNTAAVVEQLRDGRLAQAMASANRQLAKNPRDVRMRFLKAVIQQQAGQTAAAIGTYQRLALDHPDLVEVHINLAAIYLAQGLGEKARDALETAKRASRSHAVTYEKLGDIYEELARRSYAQVLQLEDGNKELAPQLRPILQLIDLPNQTGGRTSGPADRPATSSGHKTK